MRTNLPAAFEDEDISGEKEAECEKHPKGKAEHVAAYPDHFPEKSLFIRVSRCHRVARQGRLGCRGTHKNIGFLIRSGTGAMPRRWRGLVNFLRRWSLLRDIPGTPRLRPPPRSHHDHIRRSGLAVHRLAFKSTPWLASVIEESLHLP